MFPEALNASSNLPVRYGNIIPPSDPAIPPRPITDATAFFGNMSDTVVYRLADHAWWADAARPIKSVAPQLPAPVAKTIGMTHNAKMNIPVLRAFVTLQPRRFRCPVN